MLFDYFHNITQSSNVREKLLEPCWFDFSSNLYMNYFNIRKIIVSCLLKNSMNYRFLFSCLLLLVEKMTLSSFKLLKAKRSIIGFGVKQFGTIGFQYIISELFSTQFLRLLSDYSLKKSNKWYMLSDMKKTISINNQMSFGLDRILFYASISMNQLDYELFVKFFENMDYGIYVDCITPYNHYLVNRLILSHFGIYML